MRLTLLLPEPDQDQSASSHPSDEKNHSNITFGKEKKKNCLQKWTNRPIYSFTAKELTLIFFRTRCVCGGRGQGGGGFKHPPFGFILLFFLFCFLCVCVCFVVFCSLTCVRGLSCTGIPLPRVWKFTLFETDLFLRYRGKSVGSPPSSPPPPFAQRPFFSAGVASQLASNCKTPPLKTSSVCH